MARKLITNYTDKRGAAQQNDMNRELYEGISALSEALLELSGSAISTLSDESSQRISAVRRSIGGTENGKDV